MQQESNALKATLSSAAHHDQYWWPPDGQAARPMGPLGFSRTRSHPLSERLAAWTIRPTLRADLDRRVRYRSPTGASGSLAWLVNHLDHLLARAKSSDLGGTV
jgi:hypothetical protein